MKALRATVLLLLGLTGCASTRIPQYQGSIDNIVALEGGTSRSVRVGAFTVGEGDDVHADSVSIRGGQIRSPVNDSYVDYLRAALVQDLREAGRLDPDAEIEIAGSLVSNRLKGGVATGRAELKVRLAIRKGSEVLLDKVYSADNQWPSSLIGVVAFERGINGYADVFPKLFAAIYADPEFKAALGGPTGRPGENP